MRAPVVTVGGRQSCLVFSAVFAGF